MWSAPQTLPADQLLSNQTSATPIPLAAAAATRVTPLLSISLVGAIPRGTGAMLRNLTLGPQRAVSP